MKDFCQDILAALDAWVQQVLTPFAGTILVLERTRLIVGFGVPVAQEDHMLRAVAAALALRQQWATFPGAASPRPHTVRLGLSTGLALITPVETVATYRAHILGDVQPEAVQLAAQAPPGALVVSARLAAWLQNVTPLQALPGRDGEETVGAYRVLAEAIPALTRPVQGAGQRSPLVGREHELTLLQRLLAQAQRGRGQVVSVIGKAGMGKSRLLIEWRQRLAGEPVQYLAGRGRAVAGGGAKRPLVLPQNAAILAARSMPTQLISLEFEKCLSWPRNSQMPLSGLYHT